MTRCWHKKKNLGLQHFSQNHAFNSSPVDEPNPFSKARQPFLVSWFLCGRETNTSPVIWALMSKFPNCDYPGVQEMHHLYTSFPGPILRAQPAAGWGGLRSRLPNGSEISRAEEDAPRCGSATASLGRSLRENVRPEGAGQLGVFLTWWYQRGFSSERFHQMKGSINNFHRKRRESWPSDSISGRDRLSLARRNITIPGKIW